MILGDRFVVSFHETTPTLFDTLRNRISATKSRIRRFSSDYLLFALCDIVIDQYFALLENVGETIETTEDELIMSPVKCQSGSYLQVKKATGICKENDLANPRSNHRITNIGTRTD